MRDIWNNYKIHIIYILIILCLGTICVTSINSCTDAKKSSIQNIVALTDSIKQYSGKNSELVAQKTILEGDIELLKQTNKDLYDKLNSIKVNDPNTVIQVSGNIDYNSVKKDTVWVCQKEQTESSVVSDSIIYKNFDFSNKYRELTGTVWKKDSLIGLNIEKDKMFFDYTIAIKNDQLYITSDNPYVQYNSLTGYVNQIPKEKKWSIGPVIGVGFSTSGKITPYIGVGLSYNLIRW